MRAMALSEPADVATRPLRRVERPMPEPDAGEIRVRVAACGVCRTDLHVVEGDLPTRTPGIVPGHEIVGRVDAVGADVRRFRSGDRVGVAWLHATCGRCRFCATERENLCLTPRFTGWDRPGGYAEFVCVPADFAHALPEGPSARELAPLLCAGIIGYRAFVLSGARRGAHLGLYGFGGSAHIVIQIARHAGCDVSVLTRGGPHAKHARELGACFVGESAEPPPRKLDAAILFAPAGELVPAALEALDRGGTLAIAGIHLTDIPTLDYDRHLFQERVVRSVTSNTRDDARELLRLAETIPIETSTVAYPLEAANDALADLKAGRISGAAVLEIAAETDR